MQQNKLSNNTTQNLCFPFQIVLPTYLPPSVTLETRDIPGLKAEVKYCFTAELLGTVCKSTFEVQIMRAVTLAKPLKASTTNRVGGIINAFKSETETNFSIDKITF